MSELAKGRLKELPARPSPELRVSKKESVNFGARETTGLSPGPSPFGEGGNDVEFWLDSEFATPDDEAIERCNSIWQSPAPACLILRVQLPPRQKERGPGKEARPSSDHLEAPNYRWGVFRPAIRTVGLVVETCPMWHLPRSGIAPL